MLRKFFCVLEVFDCFSENGDIISRHSEHRITQRTQEAAYFARGVVVIYAQSFLRGFVTDSTPPVLFLRQGVIFRGRQLEGFLSRLGWFYVVVFSLLVMRLAVDAVVFLAATEAVSGSPVSFAWPEYVYGQDFFTPWTPLMSGRHRTAILPPPVLYLDTCFAVYAIAVRSLPVSVELRDRFNLFTCSAQLCIVHGDIIRREHLLVKCFLEKDLT